MNEKQELIARALEIAILLIGEEAKPEHIQSFEAAPNNVYINDTLLFTMRNVIKVIKSENLFDEGIYHASSDNRKIEGFEVNCYVPGH